MLKINELKEALKQINIGSAFSQFMPRAYYNMDDDSIIVCDLEIMTEFNNKYFDGTLDENYINSSIKTKALSELYPNYFFIDCYISKGDMNLWFLSKIEDKNIHDELYDLYFHKENLSGFKKCLLKNNLFDFYLEFQDNYYEKEALRWCNENAIPYEVESC